MVKREPKLTKSGKIDGRSSASVQNANYARSALLSYIRKGKQLAKQVESEDDEFSDEDQEEDEYSDEGPEVDPMEQSVYDISDTLEIEEEEKAPVERQPTQLEIDMFEMKSLLTNLSKKQEMPPPTPKLEPVKAVVQPEPELSFYHRQRQQANDINKKLADAFNSQWGN